MTLEEEYFKKYEVSIPDLISYGFTQENDGYKYKESIVEDDFTCVISISNNQVTGQVIDSFDDSEYVNFRLHRQLGEYASIVKEEYMLVLEDIRNNCFRKRLYQSDQAMRLNDYLITHYPTKPEDFVDDCIAYKNEDGKWFALVLNRPRLKVTGTDSSTVDILNIKTDDATEALLKQEGVYECYHMNKKKWVSIILDDTLKDEIIEKLINYSYLNTKPTQKVQGEWIVPISQDKAYFDQNFELEGSILSKQSAKIQIGDIVYLYLSKPYSSICYKTKVIENNIPYTHSKTSTKHLMLLELIESYDETLYTLDTLRSYNVNTIRSARYMPKALSKYINGE